MSELNRLKQAMLKIMDKSTDREEEFPHAISAAEVLIEALHFEPILGNASADLHQRVAALESKVGELRDSVYGPPQPQAEEPKPATAPKAPKAPKPVKTATAMKP